MTTKTEKIRVAVNTTQVKELEISFPYYVQDGCTVIKFFDSNEAIWVTDYPFTKEIQHSNAGVPENWLAFDPITEEEFNEKFNEVMNSLINIKTNGDEKDI